MPLTIVVVDADGDTDEYNAIAYTRDVATGNLKIQIDRERIVELEPEDYAGGPLIIFDNYDSLDTFDYMH